MAKRTPNRLLTDALREIKNTRSRFVSLLVLSALAVCFLAGLRATEPDMKRSADRYFDEQRLMDLHILSTLGLTDADAGALAAVEGVETVEPAYTIDAMLRFGRMRSSSRVCPIRRAGSTRRILRRAVCLSVRTNVWWSRIF